MKAISFIKKVSIACLFLLLPLANSTASVPDQFNGTETDSVFQKAYDHLFNLNLEKAQSLLLSEETTHQHYLTCLIACIQVYLNDTAGAYEQFDESVKLALGYYSDNPEDAYASYYEAYVYLLESFVAAKEGAEFKAALLLRKSHLTLKKHEEEHPDLPENEKLRGLLNIILGSIPDNFKWMAHLFGMKGNITEGLNQLTSYSRSRQYDAREAFHILNLSRVFILNSTPEQNDIQSKKPLSLFLNSVAYKKSGNARMAIQTFRQLDVESIHPLMQYTIAECYLQLGRYNEALQHYTYFRQHYKGNAFIKDALYKTSIIHYLKGELGTMESFRNRVIAEGSNDAEADKYALDAAKKGAYGNPELIKIRYFTDGGALQEALEVVNSIEISELNQEEFLEYHYRKARLLHKLNRLEQAVAAYKIVIYQQVDDHYYAPNACLQLAYILADRSEYDQAREYLTRIGDYRNYPYQRSISNKAQALLNQLPD